MNKIADFIGDLEFSHDSEDCLIWKDIYLCFFPTMLGMHKHSADGNHQRNGIDRSIILSNSKQILIDEKVRREEYDDILLEYVSDRERNAPGWVCKPLLSDYIAYLKPSRKCYLLPVLQLQSAWAMHREEWLENYGTKESPNKGWMTLNCPVPEKVLYRSMCNTLFYRP